MVSGKMILLYFFIVFINMTLCIVISLFAIKFLLKNMSSRKAGNLFCSLLNPQCYTEYSRNIS